MHLCLLPRGLHEASSCGARPLPASGWHLVPLHSALPGVPAQPGGSASAQCLPLGGRH